MKQVKLMIVEDETIVALDLQDHLQSLGYEVVGTASTGAEAVRKAEKSRPDLVLMDIILKGSMDGVEAAEIIRTRFGIPVIFLTACADDATLQRAKVTEPFAYVLKPYEERELHGHIEIALYRHSMEKRLRESEERYSLATQGANDGLWDWNLECGQIYLSQRWKGMLGYQDGQIGERPEDWLERVHPADRPELSRRLQEHIKGGSPHFECEYRILDAAGSYRWMLCRGLALRDRGGNPYRMAGSQTDITERKIYNPITGLPNRTLLLDRLDRAIERIAGGSSHAFALMALDIQGYHAVNNNLGCDAADQLLAQVARRLQHCVQPQDTVAHVRDDDFVILLEEVKDAVDATLVAARIRRQFEQPFQLCESRVHAAAAIGIALSNEATADAESILRDAHAAMHRAKSEGRGGCEIFDKEMHSLALASLQLEADLRGALHRGELEVYYQPIVCLRTGRLTAFEALVRWQRQAGLALPGDFLPIAESTDLIMPMERWVLREACRQTARWNRNLPTGCTTALNVNLSARHYTCRDLIIELEDIFRSEGIEPAQLRLEITESGLMEDTVAISAMLKQIRALGVQIHLDDFGTGYSSLSYLHRFPMDTLKIDRCFVGSLGQSDDTRKIVETIITLARQLKMEVIAEGIESLRQVRELQALGCHYAQGYYFSRPLSAASAASLLAERAPWADAFESHRYPAPAFAAGR